jgi:hypothetical protein
VVGLGMGAAKAVGCRKKFSAVAATGAGAGTEDEAEAKDERSMNGRVVLYQRLTSVLRHRRHR